MSIKLYDDAIIEKFRRWTAGIDLHVYDVGESRRLFEVLADDKNDQSIKLPIIALRRSGGYSIKNTSKRSMTYDGARVALSEQAGAQLNVIPISITYQLDIYTRYLEEADEYMRNFIFNLINYPKLSVNIPYEDLGLIHDCSISINPEVDDNSDIPERLIPTQFTRLSLGFTIDDAYLFDVRVKNNISIVEFQIRSDDESIIELIK